MEGDLEVLGVGMLGPNQVTKMSLSPLLLVRAREAFGTNGTVLVAVCAVRAVPVPVLCLCCVGCQRPPSRGAEGVRGEQPRL